ncbi:serine/threonine-protein phosphatase 6 regulatory ankyrin repeat subunit B-like [Gigantopelta aegis]|uniref:serine/threonine-protein phosphatase 6 regulatory ankyrin repeat subunit B-like n=1 Tax=Gigantopelta aegis TaxID=1735272 RepID=UPI001B888704|nr:serine/threonine-protein phosphatase 6 regulatory ankyrin repeat subunit B-like [Gigantopelta aegis]
MFKRGTLKEDCLDPFEQDEETLHLINTLKNVCSINTGVSLGQIKTAAQSITGVYLEYNEINKSYSFIHQSVFDTLFLQFSGEFLKNSIEVCPLSMLLEYVVTPRAPTRSIVTVMVKKENYKFLAKRLTDELKGTRHVEDETNVPNIRTILSHPSFKDEEFVKFITEIVWNNDVLAEILNQKLDGQELHVEVAFTKDTVEQTWKYVENEDKIVNIENKGSTPLLLAITVKSFDVCLYLLDKGADPNVTDAEQNYPLHLAVCDDELDTVAEKEVVTEKMNKHTGSPMEVIKRLVEKGAKLNVVDASGNTPLHIAAHYSSVDVVRYLVEKGLQIDLPNGNGAMPIHLASAHNTSDVCLCILNNGAVPNVTDAHSKSPLHFAVCNRDANVVVTLIHHGAKLDNVDEFGNTPLHIATKEGSLQAVSDLMDMKSEETLANDDVMSLFNLAVEHNTEDVAMYFLHKISDPKSVGNTEMDSPLHLAAKVHAPRLVKALVEGGASVNKKDRSGNTPLLATLQYYPKVERKNLVECMTYLISNGSLVNVADHNGRTPLHLATSLPSHVSDWSLVCVTYLVEHGSDINAVDDRGRTPLLLSLIDHQIKISVSLYLLDKGADPNTTDISSRHPLHLAARKWVTPVLEALVEKGANVNVSDCSGNTPLHYMVQPGGERWIKYLIEKGSHINKVNNDGDAPLHIAAREENPFVGFELICRGADTNIINKENMTPLLLAADTSRSDLVHAILSKDKNVNIVDSSGEIALHKAVRQNRLESVQYLVMKGSDINLANSAGKTPLDLAEGEQCSEIREYLMAKGAISNAAGPSKDKPSS